MTLSKTTIRLDDELRAQIRELAESRNVSESQIIREGVEVVLGLTLVTQYDLGTIAMLRQKYPRMQFAEIVRELMFRARLREEGGKSKDSVLDEVLATVKRIDEKITTTTTTTIE